MRTLKLATLCCLMMFATELWSQSNTYKYVDAAQLTIVGKAMPTPNNLYHRLDTAKYNNIPKDPTRLYLYSSGIAVSFRTNSPVISVKWSAAKGKVGANMSAIAQKGLDLYIKRDGQWVFAGIAAPASDKSDVVMVTDMDSSMKECLLYLPPFDEVSLLEVGVNPKSDIEAAATPFRHKIVIYGSSIAHGASASRAGMAYPALLCRQTGLNFINMAVSGQAKMQTGIAPMLADIAPDAFILDCMPNPTPKDIRSRTVPFVKYLRERHPDVPIIFIQTIVRETTNFNMTKAAFETDKRAAAKEAVKALQDLGLRKFYFIDEDEFLGTDHNGTSDGTHPTDLGFDRMLTKIRPQIVRILKENGIE